MKVLTMTAMVVCDHLTGVVTPVPTQTLVYITGIPVLAAPYPFPVPAVIVGCPNIGTTVKPCTATVSVSAGHSDLLFIDGNAVCLDNLTGLTDGTPPSVVNYKVVSPGQDLVSVAS